MRRLIVRMRGPRFAIMLVRQMPPHDAAADGAQHGMVMRIVSGNGAYDGAFEAASGFGFAGGECRGGSNERQRGDGALHGTASAGLRGGCGVGGHRIQQACNSFYLSPMGRSRTA